MKWVVLKYMYHVTTTIRCIYSVVVIAGGSEIEKEVSVYRVNFTCETGECVRHSGIVLRQFPPIEHTPSSI
jgi:hypothetical protein